MSFFKNYLLKVKRERKCKESLFLLLGSGLQKCVKCVKTICFNLPGDIFSGSLSVLLRGQDPHLEPEPLS
jgi:hypothetical protein